MIPANPRIDMLSLRTWLAQRHRGPAYLEFVGGQLTRAAADRGWLDLRTALEVREQVTRQLLAGVLKPDGPAGCDAVFRLRRAHRWCNWMWFVPSALTLSGANLLGLPCISTTVRVDAEMDFVSRQGAEIRRYTSTGKATAYCAFYWGHFMLGAGGADLNYAVPGAATHAAINRAVQSLATKIQANAEDLRHAIVARR